LIAKKEEENILKLKKSFPELQVLRPQLDYTPPSFVTLLFTDLGVLTPSAVFEIQVKLIPKNVRLSFP